MTDKEIIQALRCCEKEVCADGGLCPLFSDADCIVHLREAVTDLIERLTAENAKAEAERDALLEYAKLFTGCDTCKHSNYCKTDSECNACAQDVQGNCYCKDCERGSNWEWRGLPEAPEAHNGKENS